MKQVLSRICGVLLLLLLTAGLTACNREQSVAGITDNNLNQHAGNHAENQPNGTTTPSPTQQQDPTQQTSADQPHRHTLEELSATIIAAGEFWNRWYVSHNTFEWTHIDDSRRNWQPWDETITPAHHPLSRGYAMLLPSSGFANLYDLGDYLSQFYTQAWVARGIDAGGFGESKVEMAFMADEYIHIFGWGNTIEEYDGELYIFIQFEWSARPDWRSATHTIIEQDGNRAVVETIVPTYVHGYFPNYDMPTIIYRFTLIDGKIDNGVGRLEQPETPQDSHDDHIWQGFHARFEDARLFIYRAEDVALESFDALHAIRHPGFPGLSTEHGDTMLIGASQAIYNVSLIIIESVWDEVANQDGFTVTDSFMITETLQPGEGITISDYISAGTLPWSGITFTVAPGERYFFAINHDNSDSLNWFILLDITGQMLAG